MDTPIKVTVIRSNRRRGAVAEALALLADELAERVARDPAPVVLPDLQSPGRLWSCTHRDTLSAVLDAMLAAGASAVRIVNSGGVTAESRHDLAARLGHRTEVWGRPVRFLEPSAEPARWTPIRWFGPEGEPLTVRVDTQLAASRCRISLASPRTHQRLRVGLGLANLVGAVHPEDRPALGLGGGSKRIGSVWASGLSSLVHSGRAWLAGLWLGLRSVSGGMRPTGRERRWLDELRRTHARLAALAAFLRPELSLIDGFSAMQGDGPAHGRCFPLNTVIVGTDPVAVDAVAASLLGFEPMEILYLREADRLGYGTADLARIAIVGDPPPWPRARPRRHPTDRLLRLAGSTAARPQALPHPHFRTLSTLSRERSNAHRH